MKLSLAIADPNVASFFVIRRSSGSFQAGGWQATNKDIKARGTVSVGAATDIDPQPEGDRITGMISVWCSQEMFATHAEPTPGNSDVIIWRKEQYRVMNVMPYPERGFWKAICTRMQGS